MAGGAEGATSGLGDSDGLSSSRNGEGEGEGDGDSLGSFGVWDGSSTGFDGSLLGLAGREGSREESEGDGSSEEAGADGVNGADG